MSNTIKVIYVGETGKHVVREGREKRPLKHGESVELSAVTFETFRDRFKTQDQVQAEIADLQAKLDAAKKTTASKVDDLTKLAGNPGGKKAGGKKAPN